jgi:hypothetical protein
MLLEGREQDSRIPKPRRAGGVGEDCAELAISEENRDFAEEK